MRITLTRSGGFAGITMHREIDTAKLDPADRRAVERLATRARMEKPLRDGSPDAFQYEITIDGARFTMSDTPGAWHELIDRLMKS